MKGIQNSEGDVKVSLFTDDTIACVENPIECMGGNLVELKSEFTKNTRSMY